ncbi:hypothetical protein [Nocardia tengchongensis]|uniref:hypothetical protein n=1 Tax=Nocardia tengchongensis TaxID=2055889 RepID=UPI003687CA23
MTSPTSATASMTAASGEAVHKMPARDVPPDQRAPWLMIEPGRTYQRFSNGTVGWLTLTRRWAFSDSEVTVTTTPGTSVTEFLDSALDDLADACRTDPMANPALGTVILLAIWDNEFREAGLLDGNVYLASHASIPALAKVAAWTTPTLDDPRTCEQLLHDLTDAELLYQFPVAAKFCGRYRTERQLRLNGYGRLLAQRLERSNAPAQAAARTRISAHLNAHRDQYARHMHMLTRLDRTPPGIAWENSQCLPVGVLS